MSLVGLVPLVTGLTGYCLGYVPLGVDTRHGFIRKATEEVSDGLD
jgi:hypothetical protein